MNKAEENACRGLYTKQANDEYRACLVFFTRYFSFCDQIKGIPRHDCLIGTQRIYSVKHIFEMQILPRNIFAKRR